MPVNLPAPAHLGKYEIIGLIGEGATASVYHARDTVLKREVALKILKPALIADPVSFARFAQEAQTASSLFHPHISAVLDMGEAEGRFYLVMQYVPGQSLNTYIQENGPLSVEETLRMARQIGEALDFAHQKGFIHRDVKPSNIIRTNEGDYILTDFGLMRAMETTGLTSHTGVILGTPSYIAPEIWLNQPATPATDQYALACVAAEMLTGQVLFTGDTSPAVMAAHMTRGARTLEDFADRLPAQCIPMLRRGLAKEPAKRYPSMAAFAQALASSGPPVTIPSPAPYAAPPVPAPLEKSAERPIAKLFTSKRSCAISVTVALAAMAMMVYISMIGPAATAGRATAIATMVAAGAVTSTRQPEPTFTVSASATVTPTLFHPDLILRNTLKGHSKDVRSIAFSPDGQWFATGSWDKTIRVWRADDYSIYQILNGHEGGVNSVAFAHDAWWLVSGSRDWTVRIWQVSSGKELSMLTGHHDHVSSVAFSPDDTLVASGSYDQSVRLWDISTGKETAVLAEPVGHSAPVESVAFAPSGDILASAGRDSTIQFWYVKDRQIIEKLEGHTNSVNQLAFSPDGLLLASASSDETVRVWNVLDGRLLHTIKGLSGAIFSVAFSPDNQLLAGASSESGLWVWSIASKSMLIPPTDPGGIIYCISFTPDGKSLITGMDNGSILIWDLEHLP